jgi:hypothetical protein
MAKSRLEELGDEYRKDNLIKNTYQNNESKKYSGTHPNATSDGDNKGKGTGNFLDTYNGGSDMDINGNPNEPGSGRIKNIAKNQYNEDNPYTTPDVEGDGQFTTR